MQSEQGTWSLEVADSFLNFQWEMSSEQWRSSAVSQATKLGYEDVLGGSAQGLLDISGWELIWHCLGPVLLEQV